MPELAAIPSHRPVRLAVLLAAGAPGTEVAKALLARSGEVLRVALSELQANKSSMKRA